MEEILDNIKTRDARIFDIEIGKQKRRLERMLEERKRHVGKAKRYETSTISTDGDGADGVVSFITDDIVGRISDISLTPPRKILTRAKASPSKKKKNVEEKVEDLTIDFSSEDESDVDYDPLKMKL